MLSMCSVPKKQTKFQQVWSYKLLSSCVLELLCVHIGKARVILCFCSSYNPAYPCLSIIFAYTLGFIVSPHWLAFIVRCFERLWRIDHHDSKSCVLPRFQKIAYWSCFSFFVQGDQCFTTFSFFSSIICRGAAYTLLYINIPL